VLGRELMPWQQTAADLLNEHDAAGVRCRPFVVVTIQRQAGKTTWLLAEALERCLFGGPFRRVWYTAQNGQYAREKWGELVAELTGPGAPLRRQITPKFTNGTERLVFPKARRCARSRRPRTRCTACNPTWSSSMKPGNTTPSAAPS
jgi:hypothetical protein